MSTGADNSHFVALPTRPLSLKTIERIAAAARAFGWPDAALAKVGALARAARERDAKDAR